jgi:hypothetical protein
MHGMWGPHFLERFERDIMLLLMTRTSRFILVILALEGAANLVRLGGSCS